MMDMLWYIGKEAGIRMLLMLSWVLLSAFINESDLMTVSMRITGMSLVGTGFFLVEYLLLILLSGFVKSNRLFNILRILGANLLYLQQVYVYGFTNNALKALPNYLALSLIPLLIAQWLLKDRMLAVLRRGLGVAIAER